MKWIKDNFKFYSFFLIIAVFLCLAFKNSFSERSLIPNLEPYPDSLYYSVPAWNLINGRGFKMSVFGTEIINTIPPAYSIYLVPFFSLFKDVRSFYFGNLLLGIFSIFIFGLIAKKIFDNNWLLIFLLEFLLVTNFYFYNLSSLLMAENLTLFITLCAVLILISKLKVKNTFFAGLIGIIFWLIKLSNLPLGLVFFVLYGLKIFIECKKNKEKVKHFLILGIFAILYGIYFRMFFLSINQTSSSSNIVAFSVEFFLNNFKYYIGSIFGGQTRYLWYQQKYLNIFVSLLAIVGLIVGFLTPKLRKITVTLVLIIFSLVIFMSFFYSADSRYILAVLPLIILLIGVLLNQISLNLDKKCFFGLLVLIVVVYLLSNQYNDKKEFLFISLKKQVGLNFRHAEQPWNYLAIKNFNDYFKNKKDNVYLATFLPPFYTNYFMNGNYKYLPIFLGQEFSESYFQKIYKKDLIEEYKNLLNSKNEVYFSNYYVNNVFDQWNKELEKIKSSFNVERVTEGCLGSCNIYRLSLKRN